MSRDKQIEEMANIMKMSLDGLGSGTHNFTGFEISTMFAKALYNAGYRKVPDGAMILTRAELDSLNKYQERFKGQDADAVIATEVAKEIFAEIEKIAMHGVTPFGLCLMSMGEASFAILKKKYTEEGK